MIIDIVLSIIVLFFIVNGLIKGVIENIISISFIVLYYFFSATIYNSLLQILPYQMKAYLIANRLLGYLLIIFIGIVLLGIILFTFKHFIKKSFVSTIDRLAGLVVGLIIGYLLICILNSGTTYLNDNMPMLIKDNKEIKNSFLLSNEFNKKYNILNGVFYYGKK
ncbi:MAG: CvpA family protein [Bacilli bacterium]|jgi:uncharacterized membrane protein required for colicin V production|nr:CvpA family protein [Bacilli bacterium]